jgi:hypothetical protein
VTKEVVQHLEADVCHHEDGHRHEPDDEDRQQKAMPTRLTIGGGTARMLGTSRHTGTPHPRPPANACSDSTRWFIVSVIGTFAASLKRHDADFERGAYYCFIARPSRGPSRSPRSVRVRAAF